MVVLNTTSFVHVDIQEKSIKRKRRQWSIKERVDAIALFDKNQSKHKTARQQDVQLLNFGIGLKIKKIYSKCIRKQKVFFMS